MKRNIIITILSTIIILLGVNSSNNASALTYSNNVDLEYTFAPTLDVSFSSNAGFVIEDLTPGTAADSNVVTVTASSNNSDGFTLAATAGKSSDSYRNNNRLVHSNNTNYFESIATDANTTLDSLGTNKWGYSVYNSSTSTWSNYNGLPAVGSTGTELAETSSAGSTSVDMKIGASSTNTQASGTFTNDINFTITAKVVTYDYAISYNANDGNPTTSGNNTVDTTNMPSNTNGSLQTGQTLLSSNQVPTRTGYDFLGWCDGTITYSNCNGNTYKPNDYLKITNATSSSINIISLTAIWGYYIQDFTSALCEEKAANEPYIVYDKRDGMSYRVQRLADGNCWMLDNLALDITEVGLDGLKGNTNADDTSLTYLKNGGGSDHYAASAVSKAWSSTSQAYYDKPMIAVNSTTSAHCNNAYCVNDPTSGEWSSSSVTQATINGVTSIAQGRIGVYYNYCAASAGYYCYGPSAGVDNPDGTTTLQDSKYDICPKGWRLPTSTTNGEFQNLYNQYRNAIPNQVTAFQRALSLPLSGAFIASIGAVSYQGHRGIFWSSTWKNANNMHYLYIENNGVNPNDGYWRSTGVSVRCLLNNN